MKKFSVFLYSVVFLLCLPALSPAGSASAPLSVSVHVKGYAKALLEPANLTVVLATEDVQRGEADLALSLNIKANTEYILEFAPLPAPYEVLAVTGLGNEFHIEKEGGFVTRKPVNGVEEKTYFVHLKLLLSKKTAPGSYPLPAFQISPVKP
jgi:hypothetical protein